MIGASIPEFPVWENEKTQTLRAGERINIFGINGECIYFAVDRIGDGVVTVRFGGIMVKPADESESP